jgi:CRP-like cAMP-binding protein
MEPSPILLNIKKHIDLTPAEGDYFISLLKEKKVERKECIVQEGEICTSINFVQQGALRAYYRDHKDNENVVMFAISDWWITDMYSFANERPAMLNIDALEESVILQLQKGDLDKLYLSIPKFERFFRILMQNAYVREQLRTMENLSMPAGDRYNNFLKKYPQFAQRVPLKQIASYLGITPEFLSLLRKRTTKRIS